MLEQTVEELLERMTYVEDKAKRLELNSKDT